MADEDMAEEEYKFEAPPADPRVVEGIKEVFFGRTVIKSEIEIRFLKVKIKDFDGEELELYECLYKVGPIEAPRLIKKGNPEDAKLISNYELLRDFRHPVAVQVENYYFNSNSMVISPVNGTFQKWLSRLHAHDLFTGDRKMLPLIRDMIIELCALVESLIEQELVPVDLGVKDLYIKTLHDGTPRLQVLLTEVRMVSTTADVEEAWESVKKIVQECFDLHGFVGNEATTSFCNFIGAPDKNIRRLLDDFPDHWDDSRKGLFLLESCAHATEVSVKINYKSGLTWPIRPDGQGHPILLEQLLAHARAIKRTSYDVRFPNDYVKLCRNSYKHYSKIPEWLKEELGGSKAGLLRQIEEWSPNIWSKLYRALNSR